MTTRKIKVKYPVTTIEYKEREFEFPIYYKEVTEDQQGNMVWVEHFKVEEERTIRVIYDPTQDGLFLRERYLIEIKRTKLEDHISTLDNHDFEYENNLTEEEFIDALEDVEKFILKIKANER